VAAKLGICGAEVRLPLVPVTDATQKLLDAAIAHAGLKAR
jgi:4-hydroxy-tetrahydrodipicolinate synthase